MNNNISSTICAGLLVFGAVSSASADTVNVLFSNVSGDTINYSFTTTATEFTEDGNTFIEWSETFDSAVFNVGGVITPYSSSNSILELGSRFGNSSFEVSGSSGEEVFSQMEFYGEIEFVDGILTMNPFGGVQPDIFSGASYTFDWDGETELLRAFDSTSAYTTVAVSTVSAVPIPAAVWLFGSGLIGLVGVARRHSV